MPDFIVLMVCTGNVCRSPQAESLLAARVAVFNSPTSSVDVASAGTQALVGQPMTDQALAYAVQFGGANLGHRATLVSAEVIQNADLILGMAKEHRRSVARLAPEASRRTFTLVEFARIVTGCIVDAEHGSLALPPLGDWTAWQTLAAVRRGYYPTPSEETDDIVDPYRRSDRTYAASAERISRAIDILVHAIYSRK